MTYMDDLKKRLADAVANPDTTGRWLNPPDLPDCPRCKRADWIGIEVRGEYDGVLFWRCAGCTHHVHRFPVGHWLREKASPYVGKDRDFRTGRWVKS